MWHPFMPSPPDDKMKSVVSKSVIDVFRTMAAMKLEEVDPFTCKELAGEQVVGAVGFVGAVTGMVYIHVPLAFARSITASILRQKTVEDGEEVNDVMGELSNMIGGKLKSFLAVSGFPCALSAPSITRGGNLRIESAREGSRQHLVFRPTGHNYLVVINVTMAREEVGSTVYPKHPKDIPLRVINRGAVDGVMSGIVTTVMAPLSAKLSDYVMRMGHSSAHLTGIAVQLLTKGKVLVDFEAHSERLELVDQGDLLDLIQAVKLLEDYLSQMAPPEAQHTQGKRATQAIRLDASATAKK